MSALLRNLAHPCFDAETLKVLSSEGIETVADILLSPNRTRISELLGSQKSLEIFDILQAAFCPQTVTGLQLLRGRLARSFCVSTGCESLNNLLGGGIKSGEWTDFAGQMATGKTQLCFAASLHCAAGSEDSVNTTKELTSNTDPRVVFFDCSASFSHDRLVSMAAASPTLASKEKVELILSKIFVVRVLTPQALLTHLTELVDSIRSPIVLAGSPWRQVKMIIVDGLAPLLTPALSAAKQTTGHGWLAEIARMLKIIMTRLQCAIVTTNWMSSTGGAQQVGHAETGPRPATLRPGLGEGWSSIMNNTVLLTHVTSNDESIARLRFPLVAVEVAKSSSAVTNHVIRLQLSQRGFDDV
eukprot:TRINITY_DN4055_c0_g4_i3.p1 TRINITY_DN4055_c0_g4~~TRINITY_DN4055_c0_g4_i3.p1  ORF type:complete len:357 (-),score=27.83 TRINITY_DN4055_c0_g4_i3:1032-2102(-)